MEKLLRGPFFSFEGDKAYDTVNFKKLLSILNNRIKDEHLLKLKVPIDLSEYVINDPDSFQLEYLKGLDPNYLKKKKLDFRFFSNMAPINPLFY